MSHNSQQFFTKVTVKSYPVLLHISESVFCVRAVQLNFVNESKVPRVITLPLQLPYLQNHKPEWKKDMKRFIKDSLSRGCIQSHLLGWSWVWAVATMPADYNGTWEMETNENFEGYMVALGKGQNINYIKRKWFNSKSNPSIN